MKHEPTPKSYQILGCMVIKDKNQTNKQTSPKLKSKCVVQNI